MDIDNAYSVNEIEAARAALGRANAVFNQQNAKQAIEDLNRLVARYPLYLSAHRLLAKIYLQTENIAAAYLHLSFAASGNPDDGFSLVNLEAADFELGFLDHATNQFESLETSMTQPEERAVHYFNKGKILYRKNEYQAAGEAFQACVAFNPTHDEALIRTIECMQADGRISQAFQITQDLLNGSSAPGLELLSVASDLPDLLLSRLAARMAPHVDKIECRDVGSRMTVDFLKARIRHVSGDYEGAWQAAKSANLVKREQVHADRARDRQWEKTILDWSRCGDFQKRSGQPSNTSTPLFILGPSRSGKTTLEALLSTFQGVRRGFENKILSSAVSKTNNASGMLPSGFLPFLPDSLLPRFYENYYRMIEARSAGSRVFTTTTPGLVAHVQAIKCALPGAKFVLMNRAPHDLMVRTYFKNYRSGHSHACDPIWIGEYIEWYDQFARQWKLHFPDCVKILSYEQLVSDPDKVLREVAEWVGLARRSVAGELKVGDDRGVSRPYVSILEREGAIAPSRN